MTTITIQLPDEIVKNLVNKANQHNSNLETEAAATIVAAISSESNLTQAERLNDVMDKIVAENTDLYKRLA
jgi:plasmid stability protein